MAEGHIRGGKAKAAAFMPPKDLKLSVFQIVGLRIPAIWRLGVVHVAGPSQRTLYGRADVRRTVVDEVGLAVEADNDPPRHAAIVGWPIEKSAQKLYALDLAGRAQTYTYHP